jgi:hypothetical protein
MRQIGIGSRTIYFERWYFSLSVIDELEKQFVHYDFLICCCFFSIKSILPHSIWREPNQLGKYNRIWEKVAKTKGTKKLRKTTGQIQMDSKISGKLIWQNWGKWGQIARKEGEAKQTRKTDDHHLQWHIAFFNINFIYSIFSAQISEGLS